MNNKIFYGSPNVRIVYIITKNLFSELPGEFCNIWEANNMASGGGYYREVREVRVRKEYMGNNNVCPFAKCDAICKNDKGLAIHIGKMHQKPPKPDAKVNYLVNNFGQLNLNNWSLPPALLHTSLLNQSYDTRSKWLELRSELINWIRFLIALCSKLDHLISLPVCLFFFELCSMSTIWL